MLHPPLQQRLTACGIVCVLLAGARPLGAAELQLDGKQIFANHCAHCHGENGAGGEEHPTPLVGNLSVAELAKLIGETMPADDPDTLSADESRAVAAYVHETFYSPIAQARNQPARIELARLTVRQYRHAVADLIGSLDKPVKWSDERGLQGEYFKSRQPRSRGERVARRVDPEVRFDFGADAPLPEIEDPRVFSIRWSGSVLAPETGECEFIVRTEHAARLWINDRETPLIDAWVKSGDETEYRASQYLVGGRAYSIKLEFTKAKQGVNDSDKQKEKPPSAPASVELLWQRPGGVPETIPGRNLAPEAVPEQFICKTPFPPDDRSYGWERGTTVSQAWDEATTGAALMAAGYILDRIDRLARTKEDAADRTEKLREYCRTFAERAFRKPLTDSLSQAFVDRQFEAASDPDLAVRRVVLLVLKSPRFLFRELEGGTDPHHVASRLSFGLWDSIPDRELLKAAQSGQLATPDDVRRQAERMLSDVRARHKLHEFLISWLHLEGHGELSKDAERFSDFDASALADLKMSLDLFLDEVVWSENSDFRQLLLAEEVYLNDRLAKLYESEATASAKFTPTKLDGGRRAGVLTHPFVMASFASATESSPIHRGVFLARGVMGKTLRPPPEAFTPLPPEFHPDLTTRERVALQTEAANCMVCHQIINPLGFTLERFDAVGRYRDTDRGKPVDDSASYPAPDGATVTFHGARELATYLANDKHCHAAFVEKLFHHLVQQSIRAYGPETLENLRQSFAASNFHIRKLAVEIMVASALHGRDNTEAPPDATAHQESTVNTR